MTNSSSPWKDVTGVGRGLRESDTDLGKGGTTKEEDALIEALMGPRAQRKKSRYSGNGPKPA